MTHPTCETRHTAPVEDSPSRPHDHLDGHPTPMERGTSKEHTIGHHLSTDVTAKRLSALINGYQAGALLYTAVKLDLPDRLTAPTTADAIAGQLGLSTPHLLRLLRALVGIGVCEETAPNTYVLSPEGQLLVRDADASVREQALLAVDQYWSAWAALSHTVTTGQTAFRHVYRVDPWQYRLDHPEQGAMFQSWLSKETHTMASTIVADLNLKGVESVVDIATGGGGLAAALLAAHPQLTVGLFDRAEVLAHTRSDLSLTPDQLARCEWIPGDFFKAVPRGSDLYLLKSVLHDWDDEHCLQILTQCRKAMSSTAKLVLIERLLPECPNVEPHVIALDMHMMVLHGGRERNLTEYQALLQQSHLVLHKVEKCSTGFALIEARAI